jgi:hypothetical protein
VTRVRRAAVLVGIVAAGTASFVVTRAALAGPDDGRLVTIQDVPADVRAELETTWGRFVEQFAARRSCWPDVAVELVRRVEGGDARYVVGRALIEIEIPTTPARFSESLVHELAHHVEHTCAEFRELRDVLHPRLGGPERSWAGGDVWEATPSEIWAEAVVQLVNGERVRHARDMPLAGDVLDAVRTWSRADN